MSDITIGREHKRAFDSIVSIYTTTQDKDIKALIKSVDTRHNIIETPSHRFIYSDKTAGLNADDGTGRLSMDKGGASWFSAFRGESFSDGSAAWLGLIDQVAERYHYAYSLLEFKRKEFVTTAADIQRHQTKIRHICSFIEGLNVDTLHIEHMDDNAVEHIYGTTLRIELSGGTGAAVPVLCKVYFRPKADGTLSPLSSREADKVDAVLPELIGESQNAKINDRDSAEIIDSVMSAMERLCSPNSKGIDGYTFGDCICYSDAEDDIIKDAELVEEMASTLSHENANLECTSIRTLGIFHLEWEKATYSISMDGDKILEACIGPSDSIILTCAKCGEVLVDNNSVLYNDIAEDGESVKRAVYIPLDSECDIETVEHIAMSDFARHYKYVECDNCTRLSASCKKLMCVSLTFTVNINGETVYKCGNCPYPEVVMTDERGRKMYTPALAFARDRMDMIPREDIVECNCCGRPFSKALEERDSGAYGLCPLCESAISCPPEQIALAKKRYRRYSKMLSPAVKLAHIGQRKLCFEDEDMIVFRLGKTSYVADKLDLSEEGLLTAPQRR